MDATKIDSLFEEVQRNIEYQKYELEISKTKAFKLWVLCYNKRVKKPLGIFGMECPECGGKLSKKTVKDTKYTHRKCGKCDYEYITNTSTIQCVAILVPLTLILVGIISTMVVTGLWEAMK